MSWETYDWPACVCLQLIGALFIQYEPDIAPQQGWSVCAQRP